jgi:hypothetical protein
MRIRTEPDSARSWQKPVIAADEVLSALSFLYDGTYEASEAMGVIRP